jgi:hypothetical protein
MAPYDISYEAVATGAGVVFSSFENLTGGTAADTFAFSDTGNVTGNVNGGSGANVLDVSGYTSPATVNLQTKKATLVGGTWSNLGNFVGDNSTLSAGRHRSLFDSATTGRRSPTGVWPRPATG